MDAPSTETRPRIEVTVLRLSGIVHHGKPMTHRASQKRSWWPKARRKQGENAEVEAVAAVGFAGSAEDTRILSSRFCPHMELPVIESQRTERRLLPSKEETATDEEDSDRGLRFTFGDRDLPHATVLLRERDPKLRSWSGLHRHAHKMKPSRASDDRVDSAGLELSLGDTATTMTDLTDFGSDETATLMTSPTLHSTLGGGGTVIWSTPDLSAALPDIIEMRVRVYGASEPRRCRPRLTQDDALTGVSHLVLFGHQDDVGKTAVLDLPVKSPPDSSGSAPWGFSERGAFLRIQVRVLAPEASAEMVTPESATEILHSPVPLVRQSTSYMLDMMETYASQIRDNERAARDYCRAQKRAMDIYVPNRANSASFVAISASAKQIQPLPLALTSTSSKCGAIWNWNRVVSTLKFALDPSANPGEEEDSDDEDDCTRNDRDARPIQMNLSDASTIATSDSMQLS
jgi:hypothetical protein